MGSMVAPAGEGKEGEGDIGNWDGGQKHHHVIASDALITEFKKGTDCSAEPKPRHHATAGVQDDCFPA